MSTCVKQGHGTEVREESGLQAGRTWGGLTSLQPLRAWEERRESRALGAESRTALLARKHLRERLRRASRRCWKALLFLTVAPPAAGSVVVATTGGEARWVVLGMCIAIGPALATAFLVGASGVTNEAMGLVAEGLTASEFRRRCRRHWNLLNGLTLRPYQLDHVAVSVAGVLVIETKWSMSRWSGKDTYTRNAINRAIGQASVGKHHVAYLLRDLVAESDVQSLVVLWSPAGVEDRRDSSNDGGCTVVLGKDLSSWLDDFEASRADRIDPRPVWAELRRVAAEGDDLDREHGLVPRPTVAARYLTNIAAPLLATFGSLCAFAYSRSIGLLITVGVTVLIALSLSWSAKRRNKLKPTLLAWTVTSGVWVSLTIVTQLVAALHGS